MELTEKIQEVFRDYEFKPTIVWKPIAKLEPGQVLDKCFNLEGKLAYILKSNEGNRLIYGEQNSKLISEQIRAKVVANNLYMIYKIDSDAEAIALTNPEKESSWSRVGESYPKITEFSTGL